MLLIPLQPIPSQIVSANLAGQPTQIKVYQKMFGLFVDVSVNNKLIIGGVIARNGVKIVRSAYLGFIGDLFFDDAQGTSDPTYTGLGSRFSLVYLEPSDSA
jgi:hypothetical protein